MKNSRIYIFFSILLFVGCTRKAYLPAPADVGINVHGAYISIQRDFKSDVKGELILVDSNYVIVMDAKSGTLTNVPLYEVKKFWLNYAKGNKRWWTIPVFTAFTLSHGFFALGTAPLTLITTSAIALTADNAYSYNHNSLSIDRLNTFARYPQGVEESKRIWIKPYYEKR